MIVRENLVATEAELYVGARIQAGGLVAVLTLDRAEDVVPVAEALLAGGVSTIEMTLRTPIALDAIRTVRRSVPGILIGAGTVLTPTQAQQAADAGAAFGVAPGTNPRVLDTARRIGLPFVPGVYTPSDIEAALGFECTFLKFFPAGGCGGGLEYLRVAAAPYAHLGVKYLALGGVTLSDAAEYLRDPNVGAVGGTWPAPRSLIASCDWSGVRAAATGAVAVRDAALATRRLYP